MEQKIYPRPLSYQEKLNKFQGQTFSVPAESQSNTEVSLVSLKTDNNRIRVYITAGDNTCAFKLDFLEEGKNLVTKVHQELHFNHPVYNSKVESIIELDMNKTHLILDSKDTKEMFDRLYTFLSEKYDTNAIENDYGNIGDNQKYAFIRTFLSYANRKLQYGAFEISRSKTTAQNLSIRHGEFEELT